METPSDNPLGETPIEESTAEAFTDTLQTTVQPRRAAVAFILITIALDALALGVIIPVLPNLVKQLAGGDTGHAARVIGVFGFVFATMQFICSPTVGALSDRFGRRRVVLLSNFGLGLDYIVMALAPNMHWLFAGRVISGICAASISAAGAYIADVTPPSKRAASFGLLGGAFALGFVVGPALGGFLGGFNLRLPFWVAAALSLTNAMYGFFILPESLPKSQRARINWRRANPFGSLAFLRKHQNLTGLAGVAFLSNLAHVVLPSTFVLYAGYRYGWGEQKVGLVLALVGICSATVQAGLSRRVVGKLGERRTLLLALTLGSIAFSIYGLAPVGSLYLIGIPIMAFWGLATPSLQGLMTHRLPSNEQGRLQGALTSLYGIAAMIGPPLFANTFAHFISDRTPIHVPGAPFLLASAILLLSIPVAWRYAHPAPAAA